MGRAAASTSPLTLAPLAYRDAPMQFIESSAFTRQIVDLMEDESYRLLQGALIADPEMGSVIKGSGGIRKVRWEASGRGKRGGARIIYLYVQVRETFYMLLAYAKAAQENLSAEQLARLRRKLEEEGP